MHFSSCHCQCLHLGFVVTGSQIGWVRFQNSSAKMTRCYGDAGTFLNKVVIKENQCQPKLCNSDTHVSVRPEFTEQMSGLHLQFYLYHDVNVLAILQQT